MFTHLKQDQQDLAVRQSRLTANASDKKESCPISLKLCGQLSRTPCWLQMVMLMQNLWPHLDCDFAWVSANKFQ